MAHINPAKKHNNQTVDRKLPARNQTPQAAKTRHRYEVTIEKDKCKGCQLCIHYCVFNHLELSGDLNRRGVRYPRKKPHTECKGCGACFLVCPECCIEIYQEEKDKE